VGATGPAPNHSEHFIRLGHDPPQPLAQGYVGGVRLGYACPYQGEPRRSGPRGMAVGLGVQLGPRCVAPRRLRRTQEVSLPPVRPLRCRRWQKRALGGAGRRPATFGRRRPFPYLLTHALPPLRRPLARTHAHDAAAYARIHTPAVGTGAALRGSGAADSTPPTRLSLTARLSVHAASAATTLLLEKEGEWERALLRA
jgi:hypothetical protein